MIGEVLQRGHPEFVDQSEIDKLAEANRMMLEAKYQDDSHLFRAAVLQKLAKFNNAYEGTYWAIFHIDDVDDSGENASNLATLSGGKETLIFVQTSEKSPKIDSRVIPTIRIITNELIVPSWENDFTGNRMTFDFTLNGKDEALVFVDFTTRKDIMADDTNTFAPLFYLAENGGLAISNNTMGKNCLLNTPEVTFTQRVEGLDNNNSRPFGTYSNIEDKIYALSSGQDIFCKTEKLEPVYHSQIS
jgi:hypothetical protein